MQKKKATKKTSAKTTLKKTSKRENHESKVRLEEKIIQNLISLQKVHVNLAEKFDNLSEQLSNLLALFEMSARTFASQPHMQKTEKDKEFLNKIDSLLEQNKVLAKGLTLMEQKLRERVYGPPPSSPQNKMFRRS
jgi:hypothetical protein